MEHAPCDAEATQARLRRRSPSDAPGTVAASRADCHGPGIDPTLSSAASEDSPPSNIADKIVASLIPASPPLARRDRVAPLPMVDLHSLRPDGSMVYAIATLDESGRLINKDTVDSLAWNIGHRLEVSMTAGAIVLRAAANGALAINKHRCVAIPAAARSRCEIRGGDRVLLAAAPLHNLLVVYPLSILDDLLLSHHAGQSGSIHNGCG